MFTGLSFVLAFSRKLWLLGSGPHELQPLETHPSNRRPSQFPFARIWTLRVFSWLTFSARLCPGLPLSLHSLRGIYAPANHGLRLAVWEPQIVCHLRSQWKNIWVMPNESMYFGSDLAPFKSYHSMLPTFVGTPNHKTFSMCSVQALSTRYSNTKSGAMRISATLDRYMSGTA